MFAQDSRAEHYLTTLGVPMVYREDVKYNELEEDWSAVNHGRASGQPVVKSAVKTYRALMEEGSAAPAAILREKPDGSLEVLDGIQRLTANLETGSSMIGAYVIVCSTDTARKIRMSTNLAFSSEAPVNESEQLEQLVYHFIILGSDTFKDIAIVTRRSVTKVTQIHGRVSTRLNIKQLWDNQDQAPMLNDGLLDRIASVANVSDFKEAPKVIQRFISLIDKCKFTNGAANIYVTDFFTLKRTKGKKLETQLRSKLRNFESDALVKSRLNGGRRMDGLEKIIAKTKALETVVKEHRKSTIDNVDVVRDLHERLHTISRLLRQQCSTKIRRDMNPFTY